MPEDIINPEAEAEAAKKKAEEEAAAAKKKEEEAAAKAKTESVDYKDVLDFTEKAQSLASTTSTKDLMKDLDSVTADVTLVEKGLAKLESLSFGKLIGGPLNACISAQTDAAKASLRYVREVGIKKDKNGQDQIAVVALEFMQSGRKMKMQLPLITLVPIPNMTIDEVTYNFKVKFDTSSSVTLTAGTTDSFSAGYGMPASDSSSGSGDKAAASGGDKGAAATGGGKTATETGSKADSGDKTSGTTGNSSSSSSTKPSAQVSFSTSLSSKKDSTATKESKYSIETTMDITVTAKQGDMPGGIARMLDVLNNSIEIIDPNGTLTISSNQVELVNGKGRIFVSYLDGDGSYQVSAIKCIPQVDVIVDGDSAQITFSKAGTYLVSAGNRNKEVYVTAPVSVPTATPVSESA